MSNRVDFVCIDATTEVVPHLYLAFGLADYTLELLVQSRAMTTFREQAQRLLRRVLEYAEDQGFVVKEVANPEGLAALTAVVDAFSGLRDERQLGPIGVEWKRVEIAARDRAKNQALKLRRGRWCSADARTEIASLRAREEARCRARARNRREVCEDAITDAIENTLNSDT